MGNITSLFLASSFWETIIDIIVFIIVLTVIVGIHEFGHMIFALKGGILCREYAIGMGPKLFSKRKGEIVYSIRALPLGGFCAIAGETEEADLLKDVKQVKLNIVNNKVKGIYFDIDNEKITYPVYDVISYDLYDANQTGYLFIKVVENESEKEIEVDSKAICYSKKEEIQIAPYNRTLNSKSKGRRAMVMFGGPLMNFILALIVFFIVGLCQGFSNTKSNEIGKVANGSPYVDVLESGDRITHLSSGDLSKEITSWVDYQDFMKEYDSKYMSTPIVITYSRDDKNNLIVEAQPFIAINSAGFGNDMKSSLTKVGIVSSLSDGLGDNSELKKGDIIKSIKAYNTLNITNPTWSQIREVFSNVEGGTKTDDDYVYLTVERENVDGEIETLNIKIKPYSQYLMKNQYSINGGQYDITTSSIGLECSTKFSLVKSIGYGFKRTGQSFTLVFDTLKLLFKGSVTINNLSGPIGIFSITSQARQYGIITLLNLGGLLSVNIGFMNLLPIPALDGGRLVFVAYEAITKKKPSEKVETVLITITFVLLLGLMVFVGYQDILRLFKK